MKKQNYKIANQVRLVKLSLIILVITLSTAFNPAKATVSNYSFAMSNANYLSITGTTLFTGTWDDASSALLTIPFTFTYNSVAYTTLAVNSNGFITMGAVPATVYCGLQSSATNSIAGYGTDLVGSATSTVQYITRGTAPNRQFVVQWTDCDHFNNANANHWSFQIILNETSNTVQVVWGSSTDATTMGANTCSDAATESGNVGLLGATNVDFNIRSIANGTNTWATSVAGSALTAVCNMSSTNIPALGLTYTWTPAPSTPMSYVSSTTAFLNSGQAVSVSTTSNQIIQVQVVTTGSLSPFNVTSLALSTAGCTNASNDLANAKVYFTGISNVFATTTQFGSTAVSPSGAYTASGTATLAEGTNYFWITYDITSGATIGDILSGCCTQITGSGTMGTQTPTTTCPAGSQTIAQVGTWTLVSAPPHSNGGEMVLLSDGTVLCKTFSGGTDGYGNLWDKLTPNANGSYVNGTWSTIAPMANTRLYFSTQVLMDGRMYVAGGEYGTGGSLGETYNPLTNVWTACPAPGSTISDANSEILPDGRVLQALVAGSLTGTDIYNPVTNTYITGPTALGIHNESAWVKLADNSVLYVNRLSTSSERYIPSSNTWIADATVPVQLYDAFGDEAGGALLLPDGRAFFLGSSGHTAYYTPSGTTSAGVWTAGPDIPSGKGTPDAPAAMMVNGKILCAVSPIPTSANHFPSPTSFYEFDYLSGSNGAFTQINAPGGGTTLAISSYVTNMLDLPDGTVLYSRQNSAQYYVYTPGSGPLASGKPTINNITQTSCTTFSITGTLFNGISQGATYGDDWQMASNYPIVRLTSGSNVYYARTNNWNSTGVRRGALADTTQFTTPAGLPAGTYSLVVVANGISSNPVSFTFNPVPTLSSSLTPPAICTNTAFTYTPTSASSGATFTWTRAVVSGISNAAITTPQTTNPNEVLVNTTSSPVSVIYSYTISANGCSNNTQSVTVVVNPIPVAATITAGGNTTFCAGGSVLLSGNTNSGIWSIGGGTTSTLSATASGDYFVTNSNSCGNAVSNHILVTVNPLPAVTASNVGGCAGTPIALSGTPSGGTWSVANPYTGSSTSYTHTYTDANGCTNTSASATITVNPQPTASTISAGGPTTFCAGGSVLLSGNTNSGIWSIGGGTTSTLSATASGDYFVTNTNACGSVNSNHILVSVNPLPTISISGTTTICNGASTTLTASGASSYQWTSGPSTASNTVSPSSNTTYIVTGTDANSCSNTASQLVTVNTLPNVTITGTTSICNGSSTTLTGNGAASYQWTGGPSTPNYLVTPTSNTTYLVTGTAANGCTNAASQLVTVYSLPTVSISGTTTICNGTSTTLIASGAATYQWTGGPASANYLVSPTSNTSYTVVGTDVKGCTNTATQLVTVNPQPTASTISAGGPTTFCAGGSVLLSGNAGGTWSIGGGTTSTLSATASGDYFVTNTNSCGSINSNHILVTVNPLPTVTASDVSGCAGSSIALSGTPSGGTWSVANPYTGSSTSYTHTYTDANGCTNTSSSATITVNPLPTVSFSGLASSYNLNAAAATLTGSPTGGTFSGPGISGNTFTYTYTDIRSCSNSSSQQTSVTNCAAPAQPGTITATGGNTKVCPGDSKVYSIVAVSGATSYTWTAPVGGSIVSGQGSTSVTVSYISTFTASGTLSVVANNGCGSSAARTLAITRNTPSTPSVIIGAASGVCAGTTGTYSVTNVSGMTYNWTAPNNATISSGQGTNTVVVDFSASFTTGSLSVTANNGCGTSAARTLSILSVPATPGTITGAISAVCAGTSGTYSVTNVTGVTYNWIAPNNASISSGQGTNSIVVNFSALYTSGTLSVAGTNSCGSSALRTLAIASVPSTPNTITGPAFNNCSTTSLFSIVAVANATSYTWSTNVVGAVVTPSGTSCNISFPLFSSGTVSVTANNSCGASAIRSLAVKGTVATPATVSGNTSVTSCVDEPYFITALAGATSYIWTVPTGSTITSGQGTTNITVHFGGVSGSISAKGVNACGNGTAKTLAITVSSCARLSNGLISAADVFTNDLTIQPNPFSTSTTVYLNPELKLKNAEIVIYDMLGNEVKRVEQINDYNVVIEKDKLVPGIYMLRFNNANEKRMITRFVVE
jgi:hypothetical protein